MTVVFMTDDKWILNRGRLDPVDEEMMKEAAGDGELVMMNFEQALEAMQKEDLEKFERFQKVFAESHKLDAGVTLTIEQIKEMSAQANGRMKEFDDIFGTFLNKDTAVLLRYLRVDEHFTWRSVARRAYATAVWCLWEPPSNQLAGMSLCKAAAKLLGEDYMKAPWN